jgi:hypothetical protein
MTMVAIKMISHREHGQSLVRGVGGHGSHIIGAANTPSALKIPPPHGPSGSGGSIVPIQMTASVEAEPDSQLQHKLAPDPGLDEDGHVASLRKLKHINPRTDGRAV